MLRYISGARYELKKNNIYRKAYYIEDTFKSNNKF